MLRRRALIQTNPKNDDEIQITRQTWRSFNRCVITIGIMTALALSVAIVALMLSIFLPPHGSGSDFTAIINTTTTTAPTTPPTLPPFVLNCSDVSDCLPPPPTQLTLGSLTVTNLTVLNFVTENIEQEQSLQVDHLSVNNTFTCGANFTFADSCAVIRSVNTIHGNEGTQDFTIIGGPGIAITGGMHSLTISNSVNLTIVGNVFIVRVLFGTVTIIPLNQSAHTFFAGPANGAIGAPPQFRHLVPGDIPLLPLNTSALYGTLPVSLGGTGLSTPLLPGQLYTGDGFGNLIPVYLQGGYDVFITNHPNGTIEINVDAAVHSVGLTVPTDIFETTSPIVHENGNLSFAVVSQSNNTVWASPANGSLGTPSFRRLVETDLPLISLANKVYDILPIANGGTNSGTALNNNRLMQSAGGAVVEAAALTDGQLFIGKTGDAPQAALVTGSNGITITPGTGTLDVGFTNTPSFTTLNVNGTSTLGSFTTCGAPLQPSCLDISSQSCPGGVLSTNCIPTSGLHLLDLTVDFLTIVNSSTQVNVDIFNGTSASIDEFFVEDIHLGTSMICTGNASIASSCFDISNMQCPHGVLSESCIPDTLVVSTLQITSNFSTNNMHCLSGPIDENCVPSRIKTINGLLPTPTNDYTISALDAGIVVTANGLHGISIGNTLVTTNQSAHLFFAGPATGGPLSAPPSFRALSILDLPPLAAGQVYVGTGTGSPVVGALFNVSLALPASIFQITVPLVGDGTSGTLTAVLQQQAANTVWAGPENGAPGLPTFRNLTIQDMPAQVLTSVGLAVPTGEFTISNSPLINGGGTLTIGKANQDGNTFWAGAADGSPSTQPTFRKLVYKDLSNLNLTLGQVVAGITSGGDPVATSFVAGSGIVLTQVDGSITISASINASNIGTVTSVGLSGPSSLFNVSPSVITTSGVFDVTFVNQAGNTLFAGPANGTAGEPTMRAMVLLDMPRLYGNQIYIGDPLTDTTIVSNLTAGNGISITTTAGVTTMANTMTVGLELPSSVFSVAGSPVTSLGGTLNASFAVQSARRFFAAPATSSGTPSFRLMAATDLPALGDGQIYIGMSGTAVVSSLSAGTGITITPGPGTLTVATNFFGTVTSVDLALPSSVFSVSGNPVTSSGTLTGTFISQSANTVFAGPSGASGTPTFRLLVAADVPNLDTSKLTSGTLPIARGGTNSATALNNNRVMISSGGAIVERAAMTNGQLLIGSTGAAPAAATLTGTTNRVTVTNGAGSITLSLPQDIHTGATPTFASQTLAATTNQLVMGTTNTVTLSATAPAASRIYTLPDAGANANIVLNTAGPLTVTNTATTGQVLTATGTNTATWQTASGGGGGAVAYYIVNSTVTTSTNSLSFVAMTAMTITPPAGTYLVTFNGACSGDNVNGLTYQYALYLDATVISTTVRDFGKASGSPANDFRTSCDTVGVVSVSGTNIITVQWKSVVSGMFYAYQRSLVLLKVA